MIPSNHEIAIKSFNVAAYVCRCTTGGMEVLLIKRSSAFLDDTWQMISGKLEEGETGWEAALREIEEEVGIIPDRFYSADKVETFYEVSQNCVNICPVFVGFVDSDVEVILSNEHSDYEWVSYDRLSDYVSFTHQSVNAFWIYDHFVAKEPFAFLQISPKNLG